MINKTTLQIIRAQPEHAALLTEIAVSAKRHWNYPETWMQIWLPELTISSDYIALHEVWMMANAEKPIAFYALLAQVKDDELEHLWVLPEYIGRGIGKQLFQHMLERCKLFNISALKIYADPNAQSFYEKMGAKKVGEYATQMDEQIRILPVMEFKVS